MIAAGGINRASPAATRCSTFLSQQGIDAGDGWWVKVNQGTTNTTKRRTGGSLE